MEEEYRPKQMRLRDMPEDVYELILKEQAELKRKCKCQKSLETTIYSIIRKVTGDGT